MTGTPQKARNERGCSSLTNSMLAASVPLCHPRSDALVRRPLSKAAF